MLRTLSAALSILLAAGSLAQAQTQGTIYFAEQASSTARFFAVGGDGSNPAPVPGLGYSRASGRSDYPGGRLFLVREAVDTIPEVGDPSYSYHDLVARNVGGGRVRLTAFSGPLYIRGETTGCGWSNDGADSFFYFRAYDPSTDLSYVYRANVSGPEMLDPEFVPLAPGDARLQLVLVGRRLYDTAWSGDGTKMAYTDSYLLDGTYHGRLKVHAVGPDTSETYDVLLNDTRLTKLSVLGDIDYSPVADQVAVNANDQNIVKGKTGPKGVALFTANGGVWRFSWLQQWYETRTSGFQYGFYPTFSPDGTAVAFSGKHYRNKFWQAAVLKCSVAGGGISVVTEVPSELNQLRHIDAWRW